MYLKRFLCSKSRNYSRQFSLEIFFWDLFISNINYLGSIFTLCLPWGAFSLVCARNVRFVLYPYFLLYLFLLFIFLYWYFPWQTLAIRRIAGKGEGIVIFLVFHFHPLKNIDLVHWDFYHFILIDLFIITRLIANETCSP